MQIYKIKNDNLFYASQPQYATKEFIEEAEKRDIALFQISPVGLDVQPVVFFGFNSYEPICRSNEYLVLPKKGDEYFVCHKDLFNALFTKETSEIQKPQDTHQQNNLLMGKSFYLDAGHGGKDPGATNSPLGLEEKVAALEVILKLGKILSQANAKVYYSRQNDTYPSLTQRAEEANKLNVTAFISVHLNSSDNTSASGIETLVYSRNGKGYKLAENVQEQLILATDAKDRGVKERSDLAVLRKTTMPAILCEIGFISNNTEGKKLFTNPYQETIAKAIFDGIIATYRA